MKKSTLLLVFVLTLGFLSQAQDAQKSISRLKSQTHAIVTTNEKSGLVEFVRFPIDNAMQLSGTTLEAKAITFLNSYKSIYNLNSIEGSLNYMTTKTDVNGLKHVIFKQIYNGIPVFDGELRFHFNNVHRLTAINGNFISGISKLNQVPSLSRGQAENIAINLIIDQNLNVSGEPLMVYKNTLYVFAKGLIQENVSSHHLVYEVEIRNDADVREFLFIDAHTGRLVEQFTGMDHALNRKLYETSTNNLVWQEGDAFPGILTQWQQNEVVASGHVYNFFKNAFGFVSFNGADAIMRTINNNPNIQCPNANWNGNSANYCDGTAADDVIAHEWGHAYTQYTSDLIYAYQAGAMNESYSDIWGETIDLINNYEDAGENLAIRLSANCFISSRWKIAEDATAFGGAIRDMWNPNCNGDPGKLTDSQYRCGDTDSGGVHSNSGVPNHAYALLVDGGTYNGQTINGIGFTKAAHIFWRAQSVYLTSTSNFGNLADALEASCADLLGVNLEGLSTTQFPAGLSGQMITTADCQSVLAAILAVEMRMNPDSCGYESILADTPPPCEAYTSNPLFIENWESGIGNWTVSQLPTNASSWIPRDWQITSSLPEGRTGSAMFGADPINGDCNTSLQNGIIRLQSPIITIPNITSGNFELAFNHYLATEPEWDGGNLKYSLDNITWFVVPAPAFIYNDYNGTINSVAEGNDNPMASERAFTGTDEGSFAGSWGQSVIDLSMIGVTPDSTVQFRWEMGTDGCNGLEGWYVDEIVIYNCSATLSVSDSNMVKDGIKVFPNPSNGIFTLQKVKAIDLLKAEIFDINGRSIKSIDLGSMQNQKEIDISDVASGIYFMSVNSKNSKSVIKLIRQ